MRYLQFLTITVLATGAMLARAGSQTCSYPPLNAKFTQVAALNTNPVSSGLFGASVRVRKVAVNGAPLLETVVGTIGTNTLEIYFLDPASGLIQSHMSVALPQSMGVQNDAIGDFDADGAPDILIGNAASGVAWINKGQFDTTTGALTYPKWYQLIPAAGEYVPVNYGQSVAAGKLYGSGADVAAVGARGAKTNTTSSYGGVFLFYWNGSGFSENAPVYDPDKNPSNWFGSSVSVGAITSAGSQDLIVGAQNANTGASTSGKVWVFPAGASAGAFTLTNNVSGQLLGSKVGVADVTGDTVNDLIALTGDGSADPSGFVWNGYVQAGEPYSLKFAPAAGVSSAWSTGFDLGDVNGDGIADILVGAPQATPSGCPSNAGVAYVYLSNGPGAAFSMYTLYPPNPADPNNDFYGWAMATIQNDPTNRIFILGEKARDVTANGHTYKDAGQVYVYKVN